MKIFKRVWFPTLLWLMIYCGFSLFDLVLLVPVFIIGYVVYQIAKLPNTPTSKINASVDDFNRALRKVKESGSITPAVNNGYRESAHGEIMEADIKYMPKVY